MKQTLKRMTMISAACALLLTPAIASAKEGSGSGDLQKTTELDVSATSSPSPSQIPLKSRVQQAETELRDKLAQANEQRQANFDEKKTELLQKLDSVRQKACENHQATINRLMTVMDTNRKNSFDRIGQIATAVESFYTKKELSVTNYDDLVAKIDAAKAVAQDAIAAQQAIPSLNCNGDHPRADVADFKAKKNAAKDAITAYREAVKALIAAVKSSAEASKGSPSPSPESKT